jgi:hypothetical protein
MLLHHKVICKQKKLRALWNLSCSNRPFEKEDEIRHLLMIRRVVPEYFRPMAVLSVHRW